MAPFFPKQRHSSLWVVFGFLQLNPIKVNGSELQYYRQPVHRDGAILEESSHVFQSCTNPLTQVFLK